MDAYRENKGKSKQICTISQTRGDSEALRVDRLSRHEDKSGSLLESYITVE